MSISRLLDKDLLFIDVKCNTKEELLDFIGNKMYEKGYVKQEYTEEVKSRERHYPTGLPLGKYNCAIPHSEMTLVNIPCISIAILENPVVFNSMENSGTEIDVSLVFMLAIDDGHKQISILQELANLLQSEELVKELIFSKDTASIITIIEKLEKEKGIK